MRWLRYIFSFIWITTFLLLLLLGTAWFALQFSGVQTFAVKKVTDYITENCKANQAVPNNRSSRKVVIQIKQIGRAHV